MELIIISGRSGSGKSVALRVVEDLGYYCVDNIPVNLLPSLVRSVSDNYDKIAVSIDVRNLPKEQDEFNHIIEYLKENRYHRSLDDSCAEKAMARFRRWDTDAVKGGESVSGLRDELKAVMEKHCGVFRNEEVLKEGVQKVEQLAERLKDASIGDHSDIFNTARVEALEL